MRNVIKLLIIFMSLNFSSYCFGAEIVIESNPSEVDIYSVDSLTGTKIKIGKTPYKKKLNDFVKNYVKNNIFLLELNNQGYEPYRILMTKTSNVDISLKVNLSSNTDVKNLLKRDEMIGDLFNAQRLIRSKNLSGAMKVLDKAEVGFKGYSIISELKGTVFYLMGEPEKALSQYRIAFGKNTRNSDAYKMKVYLEKKLGVSNK